MVGGVCQGKNLDMPSILFYYSGGRHHRLQMRHTKECALSTIMWIATRTKNVVVSGDPLNSQGSWNSGAGTQAVNFTPMGPS